jgi:hypothetical protein
MTWCEALEEHQEVKTLFEEIEGLDPEDEVFSASLEELLENVEHHVAEEEDEMFRKCENYAIGRRWTASAISSKRRKASKRRQAV